MNLNQLKYFVAVAESGSFTRAAEQYYISQTAITQQVKQLEDTVGCPLLDRSTRPASLTPAGKTFLVEAKAVIERMQTAVERTRQASTGLQGTLRVGYTRGYERSSLSQTLCEFHRRCPNVLVTCFRSSADVLAAGLLNGEYDIVYTWDCTNLRLEPNIGSREIERAPLMAVLYAAHPFARRSSLCRADFKGEDILYMSPSENADSVGDAHFYELYRKAGYTPHFICRSSDTESILMMIAAEEGIAICPDYCVKKLDNADNLVFVPMRGEEEVEVIHALWRTDVEQPALRRFIQEFL